MLPYLTYNYDEIVVVDLRYMAKSTAELMQEDFDDIFIMYNSRPLSPVRRIWRDCNFKTKTALRHGALSFCPTKEKFLL